jgi:hypothetical protein
MVIRYFKRRPQEFVTVPSATGEIQDDARRIGIDFTEVVTYQAIFQLTPAVGIKVIVYRSDLIPV